MAVWAVGLHWSYISKTYFLIFVYVYVCVSACMYVCVMYVLCMYIHRCMWVLNETGRHLIPWICSTGSCE